MSIGSEMNNDVGEKVSDLTKSKKCDIKLAAAPSDLLFTSVRRLVLLLKWRKQASYQPFI